ncbi:dipeptide epimerase [Ureibacillus sinduriensis]|uniref:Dipeptide epimerase n=1 Tax=Ureibacillus sinduriensis BLB-1 = JCM 15800 TaxID=1384057 RepID=A0A0A3HPC6_9BACL|nr:dipeptide epimerase [Ureibacillus sinduriensis]KGR74396.1 L-alanine-DL-glutamate epimerase [Ureibacillus sinduriensis BLB-1 = JCM 15800]
MKITDIKVGVVEAPLITPFKTALRTVEKIQNIAIYIHTDAGRIGIGEAAPTAVITGETKASISNAITEYIKPAIIGMDIEEFAQIMERLEKCIHKNTSAKAAVDMALYDLLAQSYKTPLFKLLGGYRKELITDITISANDVDEMVKDSLAAATKGFHILKVKVGKDPAGDVKRIVAIREAVGPNVILRIDANQGWTPKQAVQIIHALEDADTNIELVEQPVHYNDIEGMRYVTANTLTKILADESVFSPKEAITLIEKRAADLINIKLMKTGGIYQAQKIVHIAEANGIECMVGCMLETKVSVSAAAHFAASQKNITMIDLDGPLLCVNDPMPGGPTFDGQVITMSIKPGIGFSL